MHTQKEKILKYLHVTQISLVICMILPSNITVFCGNKPSDMKTVVAVILVIPLLVGNRSPVRSSGII